MNIRRGLKCPVIVPANVDADRDCSSLSLGALVAMQPEELAGVDPLVMNLTVAKGVSVLADIEIADYQAIVNGWVRDFARRCLPCWEPYFHEAPQDFKNDIRYFRLGMVCQYLELELGIEYNRDQRDAQGILYTDSSDVFLDGVIDSRQGTCGNMAALQMAFGWRLGWPVSLACVSSHFILRFDDGETYYNIEATQSGHGGFKSDPDEYLIETKRLPRIAIECGSDLRALRPHEVLGSFVGLRARHVQDVGKQKGDAVKILESEPDWLLARQLFPSNRVLYKNQMVVSSMRGDSLFEPSEAGHPNTYAACLNEIQQVGVPIRPTINGTPKEPSRRISPDAIDDLFFQLEVDQ